MYTYTCKANGLTLTVKAKKDHVEALASALVKLDKINQYWRELNGVIGDDEPQFKGYMTTLFVKENHPLADPDKFAADKAALYASLPDPITTEDLPRIIKQATSIFYEHLPVVDKRITKEERDARDQSYKENEAEREAKRFTWIDAHCRDREKVEIPAGMMAIYLKQTYDDSDTMTDYFHSHAGHGEDMLLALVKKQPRTERLAREIVARYPELSALSWSWHVEEWSMGHGTYLQSQAVGELEGITTYGGVTNPHYTYEVQFNPYARGGIYAYKNYPGNQPARPEPSSTTTESGDGYNLTHDRDWTWLNFPDKPSEETREALKGMGARWSMKRRAWFFTRHVEQADIDQAIGAAPAPAPEPTPEPEPAPAPQPQPVTAPVMMAAPPQAGTQQLTLF